MLAQDVGYVRSAFDTVRGRIRSEWRREGDFVRLYAEIPQGITAKIVFGGKTVQVGCGSYEFSAEREPAPVLAAAE